MNVSPLIFLRFSSDTEEQKQVLQKTVIFCVLELIWFSASDTRFSSVWVKGGYGLTIFCLSVSSDLSNYYRTMRLRTKKINGPKVNDP